MKIWKKILSSISILFCLLVPTSQVWAVGATLSLSPTTGTFNQGCAFSLAVNLDTGGAQTDGTDAILIYDPARFNVTAVHKGVIYQDYPTADFSSPGTIKISGLASVGSTFSGSGVLASVDFKVLSTAPTDSATIIKFDFDSNNKSKTNDSNVAEHGTVAEILNQVVNGSYNIGTNACGVTVTPAGSSSPSGSLVPQGQSGFLATPTPLQSLRPGGNAPGSESQTVALALVGASFIVVGVLGLSRL